MAEFPNLGKQCSLEVCKQLDFLPFACDGCGKIFCSDHKFPDHHNCDKSNVDAASGGYDGVRSYSCVFSGCNKRELMLVICEKCQQNFCLSHRHQQDHLCEKLEVKEERSKTAEHVKQIIASRKPKPEKAKGNKSSKTAAKVALMKMKMRAVGDKGIPERDRVFLLVYLPASHKETTKAMFFSKVWTIGRVIDNVADHNRITNPNNTGSQKIITSIMDVLNLMVTEQEQETLHQDVAPYWEEGSKCPVPGCGDRVYHKYPVFRGHWNYAHYRMVEMYHCALCNFRHVLKAKLVRHLKMKHKKGAVEAAQLSLDCQKLSMNAKYIDPQGLCMPVQRVSEPNVWRKLEAAKQRKSSSATKEIADTESSVHQCRDQEMSLHVSQDGQCYTTLRDSKRWHPNSSPSAVPFKAPRPLDNYTQQ